MLKIDIETLKLIILKKIGRLSSNFKYLEVLVNISILNNNFMNVNKIIF